MCIHLFFNGFLAGGGVGVGIDTYDGTDEYIVVSFFFCLLKRVRGVYMYVCMRYISKRETNDIMRVAGSCFCSDVISTCFCDI